LKHEALRNEHYLQIFRNYRPGGWTPLLTLEGEDHLRTALEKGRGAVLWVAHFCFSPLAAKKALSHAGYKVWHVSRPEHGPVKSRLGIRFLNPICTGIENRFLAGRIVIDRETPNKATMMAARLLRKNQVVSITAGAWEGKKVASVELLGGTFELAIGPPFLASLCGAALLPVFTVRDDSRSAIKVILGEPLGVSETLDEDLRLAFLAQSFADRMAPYIQNYPDQWLDWRDLSLPGKIGAE
jgi:lauroyl/myristoyl acyltransferase